jgi:predicted phosphate transport protein (TIGR00153 family)
MSFLFPYSTDFYELFERAADKVVEGAQLLEDLVKTFDDVSLKAKRIKDVEHEGDVITHETIEKLNKTFVTPLDREDIHRLISSLDDILDFIEATSERLNLYNIHEIRPDTAILVDILVRTTREVKQAVNKLRRLKGSDSVLKHCIEINRLENESDFTSRSAIAKLFAPNADPLEVIKWKEIYDCVENAVDRCEDVANVIEGIVLKNS